MPGTAVTIQFHDLLGSEGRVIPPRFAQVAEKIRMLDVQLPFVDLVAAQEIGVALERFQRGHPAPGAVQIVTAIAQVGLVLDLQRGQTGSVALEALAQRHHAVQQAFVAAAADEHFFRRNGEPVTGFLQRRIRPEDHVARLGRSPEDGRLQAGETLHIRLQHLGVEKRGRLRVFQHDAGIIAQGEESLPFADGVGHGQKVHGHTSCSRMRKVLIS